MLLSKFLEVTKIHPGGKIKIKILKLNFKFQVPKFEVSYTYLVYILQI